MSDKTEKPVEKLSAIDKLRKEMQDEKSDLRNQVGKENTRDYQLLSSTPAQIISAMTGYTIEELDVRAKELGLNLKGSGAGDLRK